MLVKSTNSVLRSLQCLVGSLLVTGCLVTPNAFASDQRAAGQLDEQRARAAQSDTKNWLLYGRTYKGERFSPLSQIDAGTVSRLGLGWYVDIPAPDGLSATPLIVDGVAYISAPFSVVYAIDARSGKALWQYTPTIKYPTTNSISVTIAARVNRGVAVWGGKVYVTTADCHLMALDARTGKPVWDQVTCDIDKGYSITAAPQVGNGMVFLGNGISESGLKTRGYVSGYSADTGKMLWRFFTAPSDDPKENTSAAMTLAAASWSGNNWQKYGGGANAWDAISYDPELDLIYFGTAGAIPYTAVERSPDGGDTLFTESVVALRASTGEYAWHFQTTPRDNWDFNACTNIILADMEIAGRRRNVLMIAPKNGFLYVLDRRSGQFISGKNYTPVTWAKGLDPKTGRPIPNPEADFWSGGRTGTFDLYPGAWGAHSWTPMSFHPGLGLVYIPVMAAGERQHFNADGTVGGHGERIFQGAPGRLTAWDPVQEKVRWTVPMEHAFNGGTMATAGNLVFEGTATGEFAAFAADSGKRLWQYTVGAPITAAPVTYEVDGKQFVMVGVGGGNHPRFALAKEFFSKRALGPTRLLAFELGGKASLPAQPQLPAKEVPEPPPLTADAQTLERGEALFGERWCSLCHGADAQAAPLGTIPDLRYLPRGKHELWGKIVHEGLLRSRGMIAFPMSAEESNALHQYVISRAWAAYKTQNPNPKK